MSNRIAQAQEIFNGLVKRDILDPEAMAYVIANTDPMHDQEILHLCGMPDASLSDQITVKAPYQISISAPPLTTTPWQFLVHNWPWTTASASSASAITNFDLLGNWLRVPTTQPNAQVAMPSISIWRGLDNLPIGPFRSNTVGNAPIPLGLGLADNLTRGVGRLIGWGFEVYDTSAIVNKQGTVTVWRQNTNTYDKSPFFYAGPSTVGPFTSWGVTDGVTIQRPPETITEANQLLGTKSWRGEDGCYCVLVNDQESQLARMPDMTQPVVLQADFQSGPVALPSVGVLAGSFNQNLVGLQAINTPAMRWNWQPYHMSGAFFTGLHPDSTYLVRTIYFYERQPSINEPDITLLTTRSAGYHPLAMEVRTRVLQRMPIGVPVDENGFGEWAFEIAKTLSEVLKDSAFPLFKIVGKAGGAIINSIQKPVVSAGPVVRSPPVKTRKALPQTSQKKIAQQPRLPKVPQKALVPTQRKRNRSNRLKTLDVD
jgi:hypothetical protein